jgi:hypothetical protein
MEDDMLTGLLLAAAVAVTTPTSTTVSPNATVLANRTAFNQPCVWFNSTAPDRLAAAAAATLQRLGWSIQSSVGPEFTSDVALRGIAPAGALYVHSHGDHYYDAAAKRRSSGFRVDAGRCENAPTVIAPQISTARSDALPMTLAFISTCYNGERASKLPAAFGIAMQKSGPGAVGPRSFYVSYSGVAWVRAIVRFEGAFWRALRRGATSGAAFDAALLSGYVTADLLPEWWGSYSLLPTPPATELGGPRSV